MAESTELAPAGLRARKKARTRGDLYAAALRLIQAKGFDAVTIDEICREADVARATFFLHYPTKDALLTAYAEEATAELAALLASAKAGPKRSAAAELRLALGFLAERAEKHAEVVKLLVREVMSRPTAYAEANAQSRDLVALLAAIVRRGQAAGELRRGVHPELAAGVLAATYLTIVAEWVRRRDALDLTDAVAQALDLMLRGLCAPRKPKGGPTRLRRAG
jgi:AcrR family transcriptional regulator